MILILSETTDYSTNIVIEWLDKLGEPYLRINPENVLSIIKINESNILVNFKLNHEEPIEIDLLTLKGYWYRRGALRVLQKSFDAKKSIYKEINDELKNHNSVLVEFLHYVLKSKIENRIGDINENKINKLILLEKANQVGLKTPKTLICNSKKEIKNFIKENGDVITKPIAQGAAWGIKTSFDGFTIKIDKTHLNSIPDKFTPSLFQVMIDKKYEIRTFYLKGKFYSMAIFSQNDSKTVVDFRNYNIEKPNRTVPYNLPKSITRKISQLMRNLEMNCGSIDLIYGKDDEFYFLEVNPVGQFHQVSYPCNFKIEKEIAKQLSND